MSESKQLKPKKSWGPAIGFAAVVAAVVLLLWWMGRPAAPGDAARAPTPSTSASRTPLSVPAPSGSGSTHVRDLCSLEQVKKFIASQLAGEASDSDMQFVANEIMSELHQAGLEDNGCVSKNDVASVLYQLVEDTDDEVDLR